MMKTKIHFRMKLILIMIMPAFISSALYGMLDADEELGVESRSSRKRAAPHAGFDDEAFVEGVPSLKKPKTIEENNEDVIAIPTSADAMVRSLYNVPTVAQTDASVSLLNTLPPEVLNQVLFHLTSSDGWRLRLTGNKKLRLVMNQNEMNLVWKAWYTREKNNNADAFATEITSWEGLYRLTLDMQNVFKTLIFDEVKFLKKLSHVSSAEGPLHLHVQGLLREADSKNAEAFELYRRAAEQNFKPAQDVVAAALYEGKLGQNARSEQDRFTELQTLAAKGHGLAQAFVYQSIRDNELEQTHNELSLRALHQVQLLLRFFVP